jgi:phage shock protein PspC (stress-responsive transcriptional regulator)
VEHRVAELLSELQSKGVLAITIDHVKEIIERIGDPQEMDDDNGNDSSTKDEDIRQDRSFDNDNATSSTSQQARQQANASYEPQEENTRKLFRDPDNARIAGVCAGLAQYFDVDITLVRVLMLVALFAGSAGFWIYVILWIIVPKALTPAQQCEMRGISPTAENLAKFTLKNKK